MTDIPYRMHESRAPMRRGPYELIRSRTIGFSKLASAIAKTGSDGGGGRVAARDPIPFEGSLIHSYECDGDRDALRDPNGTAFPRLGSFPSRGRKARRDGRGLFNIIHNRHAVRKIPKFQGLLMRAQPGGIVLSREKAKRYAWS